MRALKMMTSVAAAASLALSGAAYAANTQSVNMLPKSSYAKRAAAPAAASSEVAAKKGSAILLGIIGLAAFIGGVVILADGDDEADTGMTPG
ncbi:hypothetical protein [Croceicoccus bisphenolivorans]|uniref:hypothetical protein n=1 Tax=Croceicoccus bisphenolivorans TaxID=1783232 RepID=UPI0008375CAC|nr:hypothetical protein [Croceicoccus bisphenolivorans]